jgi:RHS repeat-associated protein
MTTDVTDGVTAVYDPENRISTATSGGIPTTYTYDAAGNRVRKSNGNTPPDGTLYWAMMPGVVAETDLAGTTKSEYIFFDGERVARRDGPTGADGVFYYFSDHLKTASVITDATGTIKAESDYYPWGGELQFVANDSNHYKFTGKERDGETGLDYFGARYYSNGMGRWISADWSATPVPVPYADLGDPQSLNLYSYVRGLPTSRIDADGHCDWCHDAIDFVGGVAQGIVSSASWGAVGAPKSSDSNTSLYGQLVGTTIEGALSTDLAVGGGGTAIVGALGAPETGGASLLVSAAGGAAALVGTAGAVGAAKNVGAVIHAMDNKKSTTPVGQSSSGQKINAYGEKLGGNGKPQRHSKQHSTRKAAKDAARKEGKTAPEEHDGHFHPTDANGEAQHNATHHEYPK